MFVEAGSPGHAVIVLDIASDRTTGRSVMLLAQSFMPAQDIHVLANPNDARLGPWFATDFGDTLVTPEWTFKATDRRRWNEGTGGQDAVRDRGGQHPERRNK